MKNDHKENIESDPTEILIDNTQQPLISKY